MITFSGIDCGGKSTQIEKYSEYLKENNVKFTVIWSRGGYTPILEFVKRIIRTDKKATQKEHEAYRKQIHSSSIKRRTLLWVSIIDLIFYYGIYFRTIRKVIIADRYFWDTFIDFKLKYPEFNFEKWIVWRILRLVYLKPKKSIIYVIPAEVSMRRSELKFEPFPESLKERQKRIDKYNEMILRNKWDFIIDSQDSIESIFNKTLEVLK